MGTKLSWFFQTTTMIISIPSVIILTCLVISLWGGSMRFNAPMLFALAFLPMFGIGGLTGLPLGLTTSDIYLHDTYYVIGHFHYVVAPGTILALFGGIYYWFPKAWGRQMNETLGKVHFWITLLGMNLIFFPMLLQGLRHLNRRMWDQTFYPHGAEIQDLSTIQFVGAAIVLFGSLVFVWNFFQSAFKGKKVTDDNPWKATTLEWATPTPPPHGNFTEKVKVYRGPYEYSVPGAPEDYTPQHTEA
jgi:cytochrome c oxidase subunit 1